MTDDLIESVLYLIKSKRGDLGRLNYILTALQDGKTLYLSDKKYLETLISTYIGPSKRKQGEQSVEELRAELARVKAKLERFEKRGYRRPIGRKTVFFFVTFFFGWHASTTLLNEKFLHDMQDFNPYIFPLYQLKLVMPPQINFLSIEQIVILVWIAMMTTWIILGFIYLVKFIRSRYNPAAPIS